MRRNDTTGELAYYLAFRPAPGAAAALVRVAGQRWRVEETFQTGKGLTGLDQHQVRRWTSWHRWVTLAMLAHAFLTVITAAERRPTQPRRADPGHRERAPPPVRRPAAAPHHGPQRLLHWSTWRRRHQARARASHYRRRTNHHDHELRLQYLAAAISVEARVESKTARSVRSAMKISLTTARLSQWMISFFVLPSAVRRSM